MRIPVSRLIRMQVQPAAGATAFSSEISADLSDIADDFSEVARRSLTTLDPKFLTTSIIRSLRRIIDPVVKERVTG
jgi:hypothetical protein